MTQRRREAGFGFGCGLAAGGSAAGFSTGTGFPVTGKRRELL
jgi:hypothetical protein